MKSQAFLELVGEMRSDQTAYFSMRKTHPLEAREHLIRAKSLEKQVDAVVREGRLDPDEQGVSQAELYLEMINDEKE